jgi:riboflavin synthase
MFTGIVQAIGRVASAQAAASGLTLTIDPGRWAHVPAAGDSIAVDGVCLTVAERGAGGGLRFDVMRQTLDVTTLGALRVGDRVNLEHAVTPATLLGGHVVQGHVDGVATVTAATCSAAEVRLRVEPPAHLADLIIDKGSVALAGVSLTVAALCGTAFEVALIPTTLRLTTLGDVRAGSRLNIEPDYLAKIVVQWLRRNGAPGGAG